jgi:probable rRNA maturation factor
VSKEPTGVEVDVVPELEGDVDLGLVARSVQQAIATVEERDGEMLARFGAPPLNVSVRITGDAEMHELNRTYRRVDRPTDVLSFALAETESGPLPPGESLQLGDVVIDLEYARRQAQELDHSIDMEVSWLLIHGALQLLGYSHDSEEQAERMEGLETEALRALGFSRP